MNVMKNIKKYAYIAVFIACMTLCVSAHSAVTVNPDNGTVSVSVKSESDRVKIIIIDSSASMKELDSGSISFADSGVYADDATMKFGNYQFADIEIDESRPFGDYSLRVVSDSGYEEITFPYASKNQMEDIINSDNLENLIWCVNGFAENLQIDTEVYGKFDEEGKKEFLKLHMLKKGYTPENFGKNFKTNIGIYLEKRTADSLAAITDAKTSDGVKECINKYNDIYRLDFEDEAWLGLLKAEELSNIYARLVPESFEKAEDVNSKCKEKIALYYIEQGPWGNAGA